MSATSIGRKGAGYSTDFSDLGGVSLAPQRSIMRTQLLPGEQAASLPSSSDLPQDAVAPLTRFLGPSLTVASAAWVGDPVPRMRALQKALVGHALALAEDQRGSLMAAISVVETSVQWRLRLQQMRMTPAEANIKEGKKQ